MLRNLFFLSLFEAPVSSNDSTLCMYQKTWRTVVCSANTESLVVEFAVQESDCLSINP